MRLSNTSLNTSDCAGLWGTRRHLARCRPTLVTKVASERSDAAAAAPTLQNAASIAAGLGPHPAAAAAELNINHLATAGAAVFDRISSVEGFSDADISSQRAPHDAAVSALLVESAGHAAAAATHRRYQGVTTATQQTHSTSDTNPSQAWPSASPADVPQHSYSHLGFGGSSDPAGSGHSAWQPPRYRRSGLRLRSKRGLQAAEGLQQAGQNMIVDDLQRMLTGSRSTSTSSKEQDDEHLEAFIEQMLCPKTSMWKRTSSDSDSVQDGREVIDPEVLANIHTLPVERVAHQQRELVRRGQLLAALLLLEEAAAAGRRDVVQATQHKTFLRAAGKRGNTAAVLRFLQLLPAEFAHAATYNLALKACADAQDLRSALRVVDIMGIRQVPTDFLHFTTLIAVCASVGDANQAFAVFQKAKAAQQQLAAAATAAAAASGANSQQQAAAARAAPKMDGQVYGALIAACAQAIRNRSSDLREQLVVLERAFSVLQDALDLGVYLETPVWNALLMCAGRCRQLQRCFEVLDRMTEAGVTGNSITYTCLIEAAVLSGDVDMAQRIFARAMATGVTNSVHLYTAAINACMTDQHTNFEAAFEIYSTMQRHGVEPDDLLYGHLIAIAGRCRKLEVAFDLLEDMRASGLTPSTPTCSALIYACLQNNNFGAARKVYDTLVARGVPPHISQYNSLMEEYALRFQLGNVVSVLTNMTAGGVQPNANTYRILLLACQRTDQAELAFEIYQIMKARGHQPRLNNAHSICFMLLTACFSRIRSAWWPGGYPPESQASVGPYSKLPGVRSAEARQLLHVLQLGTSQNSSNAAAAAAAAGSNARQQAAGRRYMFLDNADNVNWPVLALSTYRDFISWGYKPHLEVLDRLLACLRLQIPKVLQRPDADLWQREQHLQAHMQMQPQSHTRGQQGTHGEVQSVAQQASQAFPGLGSSNSSAGDAQQPHSEWLATATLLRDLGSQRRALAAEDRPYEVPFDKRAIDAVADAISMGLLPAFKLDAPLTVDMRTFPPCVAEAYVHMLMNTMESRAATAAAEGKRQPVAQRVRLIVPPFDHNYVMWPSYVQKLHKHYNEQLLARQDQLRAEAVAARTRAALLPDDDDEDGLSGEHLGTSLGTPGAAAARRATAPQGSRRGPHMMRSWDMPNFGDDVLGADFTGYSAALASSQPGVATALHGCYIAGAVTGLAAAATFRRLKAYARVDSASGTVKLEPQEVHRWISAKLRFEDERRRITRDAEAAAVSFNSGLPYYQQQQQVFGQQQGRPAGASGWQQQQQQQVQSQQSALHHLQQGEQQSAADMQRVSGSDLLTSATSGPGQTNEATAAHDADTQQQQQQQRQLPPQHSTSPLVPGFAFTGAVGRGLSSLQQQVREIRLGLAPAAGSGISRPAAPGFTGQQIPAAAAAAAAQWGQPGQHHQQHLEHHDAPASSSGSSGSSSSSNSNTSGARRVRRSSSSSSKNRGRSAQSATASGSSDSKGPARSPAGSVDQE